jgi:segregation and condensation protein B
MANQNPKMTEKEKEAQLKALREELSREIADQLPAELLDDKRRTSEAEPEIRELADEKDAKQVIEAILFTASKPITIAELKRVLRGYTPSKIETLVRELQLEYINDNRSFRIQDIAGGFECSTDPKFAPWILKLELQRKARQATQSALETLAILAYKQPITRAEIEDLRGVDVSGVLSTLLERNLIKMVGRKEIPGRPFLYGTTEKFLEHFGLKSLQDLPNISEIKSLVENSVRREELLRTEKVITADGSELSQASNSAENSGPITIENGEQNTENRAENMAGGENKEENNENQQNNSQKSDVASLPVQQTGAAKQSENPDTSTGQAGIASSDFQPSSQ